MPDCLSSPSSPKHSRLARLVQLLLLGGTLTALSVAALGWQWSAGWSLIALGIGLSVPVWILAPGMLAMKRVNRRDTVAQATGREWLSAWLSESRAMALVFGWRQPFAWKRPADSLAPPPAVTSGAVVFIHGFVCNRGLWRPWMKRLRRAGIAYVTVNLEPLFGSIESYAPLVEQAVRRAEALGQGRPPTLICHSMGGLAARHWLTQLDRDAQRVHRIVTIGSPHHGTKVAKNSRAINGRQMQYASSWLSELSSRERQQRPEDTYGRFLCWYSNTDNIVFPASTALLPGADNRLVRGIGHLALAYDAEVVEQSLACLTADESPT